MDDLHDDVKKTLEDVRSSLEDVTGPEFEQNLHESIRAAVGTIWSEEDEESDVDQRFDVSPGSELSVRATSGRITVRAGEPGVIAVRARSRRGVRVTQEGNRVIASAPIPGGLTPARGGSTTFDISVPSDCRVEAKGTAADIVVTGVRGPLTVGSVSGDVRIEAGIGGEISTVSGDITARGLTGNLTLHTTSGDARLEDCTLDSLNFSTTSGDVHVTSPLSPNGSYLGRTISGDLTLLVPPGTGATVRLKTVSGDARISDLPVSVVKSGRRHWQGTINGGGATVELTSVSGDLRIRPGRATTRQSDPAQRSTTAGSEDVPFAADDAEFDAPSMEAPSSPDAPSTSEILDALARGDLTVEEALAQLDGV